MLPPNQELAGGLYGVKIGRMFAGESMFYSVPNGSKVAFAFLIEYLRAQNCLFIDCQMMTPLVAQFGAVVINRAEFMTILAESLS
jgi:leucyl/phenylalanyl-tRNA--protein transferase